MSEWISISESLPKKDTEVLVYGDMHPCAVGKVREKCIMPAVMECESYQEWDEEIEDCVDIVTDIEFTCTGDVQYGAVMKNVTHWQPLPEPPQ